MKPQTRTLWRVGIVAGILGLVSNSPSAAQEAPFDSTADALELIRAMQVQPGDWPQWGGSCHRNNTPAGKGIPTNWNIQTGRNIKWSVPLGSQTYGNPVVANGKVYVGTNNGSGYLKRYPREVDLGVLLCFDEETGKFLWQHSSEKLPTGRIHDWPALGICSTPCVDGARVWYVTSRGEIVCLDADGFRDGENDGPFRDEKPAQLLSSTTGGTGRPPRKVSPATSSADWDEEHEADVVWKYNMMSELQVSQHNMCNCSVTCVGDKLFAITSNGVGEAHIDFPQPRAPSFVALDKQTGKMLWTDNTPGENVLHGQWSSPAYGVFDGVPQVIFAGGDGWLYGFAPRGNGRGSSQLLWKFDCNPKESKYSLTGRSTRNHLIATPVVYDGLIYVAVGEDPEHGEGVGHLWCVDPTRRGDVSPELVFNSRNPERPIPHKRLQACEPDKGDFTKPNPNSAAVWHYGGIDSNKDGKLAHGETMHRTMSTAAIKQGLLVIPDFSGLVHCLDAKSGIPHWTHDLLAECWSSPLIVEEHIYIGDAEGKVTIFELSKQLKRVGEVAMETAVHSTPVVANNVFYIANTNQLFAIAETTAIRPQEGKPESSE